MTTMDLEEIKYLIDSAPLSRSKKGKIIVYITPEQKEAISLLINKGLERQSGGEECQVCKSCEQLKGTLCNREDVIEGYANRESEYISKIETLCNEVNSLENKINSGAHQKTISELERKNSDLQNALWRKTSELDVVVKGMTWLLKA